MPVTSKDNKTSRRKKAIKPAVAKVKTHAVVKGDVGNYEKHPFFIKKANDVKALLKKVGLPESFKTKVG